MMSNGSSENAKSRGCPGWPGLLTTASDCIELIVLRAVETTQRPWTVQICFQVVWGIVYQSLLSVSWRHSEEGPWPKTYPPRLSDQTDKASKKNFVDVATYIFRCQGLRLESSRNEQNASVLLTT